MSEYGEEERTSAGDGHGAPGEMGEEERTSAGDGLPEAADTGADNGAPGEEAGNGREALRYGHLEPNSTYERDGYIYRTDRAGRIREVRGELRLVGGERTNEATRVGRLGLALDDGGHLIGFRFGGGEGPNLVPQNRNVNRGAWKAMENYWAAALKAEKPVSVEIRALYSADEARPRAFAIRYKIDGRTTIETFHNEHSGHRWVLGHDRRR